MIRSMIDFDVPSRRRRVGPSYSPFLLGEAPDQRHLAMNSRIGTAGEPITVSPGATSRMTPLAPRSARRVPIVRWPVEAALAADHDEIAEPRAAGNADLRDQHAAAADLHVVPDLHEIINHRARRRSPCRGPAPRSIVRVGADLDIVADDDAAQVAAP